MSNFIKQNQTPFADALIREAEGLEVLRQALSESDNDLINIPLIHKVDNTELHIENIKGRPPTDEHFNKLGKGLARLHAQTADRYGFDNDNYIGLAPQPNAWRNQWGTFFLEQRLDAQLQLMTDLALQSAFSAQLAPHRNKLQDFLNDTCPYPSLLHGDLWSGNVLFDKERVWLIDPATYYGDREADIAMTEMFGGFDTGFYESYDEELPLTHHYSQKRVIYNLYHYLNHFTLFGAGYQEACEQGFHAIENL